MPGDYANPKSPPRSRQDHAFDRTVDVQVSRLRAKLDHDPDAASAIRTVRNAGYLFAQPVRRA